MVDINSLIALVPTTISGALAMLLTMVFIFISLMIVDRYIGMSANNTILQNWKRFGLFAFLAYFLTPATRVLLAPYVSTLPIPVMLQTASLLLPQFLLWVLLGELLLPEGFNLGEALVIRVKIASAAFIVYTILSLLGLFAMASSFIIGLLPI